MKMQPLPILEATPQQLRTFATDFLGLDVEPEDTEQTLFAKIMAATNGNETIYIQPEGSEPQHSQAGDPPPRVAGATAPEDPAQRMQGTLGRDDPKVTIFINNEDRNGEIYDRDVNVGVNGTVWQLQRNKPLTIPYRVFEALKLAVRDSITHDPNTGVEHSTPVNAVPWSVQQMPSEAEIAAWRERVDSAFCP